MNKLCIIKRFIILAVNNKIGAFMVYKKSVKFIKEVMHEAQVAVWPTKDETLKTMMVVLCFSVFFMLFFMLTDFVCYKMLDFLIYF